jgi:hypothetical protein
MKEIDNLNRNFSEMFYSTEEKSKITKYYTLSHPFHINQLSILTNILASRLKYNN